MSRDPRDPRDPREADDANDPERDAELLTAYVDGVSELSPDERQRTSALLARDPQARADQAAVRTLLDRLRELPAEGAEPDWMAMERSIRQAVGNDVPRPWWRSWRWLAPTMMVATAAAVLLVVWARPAPVREPKVRADVRTEVSDIRTDVRTDIDGAPRDPRPAEDVVALWLDGAEVDVDLSAADMLGEAEPGTPGDDALTEPALDDAADAEGRLLPSTNLAWVDKLDEDAIDRAEHWLARKKG